MKAERRAIFAVVMSVIVLLFGVVPGVWGAPSAQGPHTPITPATLDQVVEIGTLDQTGGGEVWSLAFSPDGTLLATGAHDGLIRLWDAPSQIELQRWNAHNLDIYALAFSPTGVMLASGGWDGHVRLWDTWAWAPLADFRGHNEPVYSVAFHPFMRWLASAGGYQDNTVRIWDTGNYRALPVLRNHYDWVTGVAYSPDGRWLASSSADGSLRVWPQFSDDEMTVLSGHTGPVGSVAWSPDSTMLATGSLDGTIRVWNMITGKTRRVLDSGYVWQVVFSPDGSLIAAGGRDGVVTFWNALNGKELASIQAHPRWVNALAFSPDGTMLATAGEEGIVKLWGIPDRQSASDYSDDGAERIEDFAMRVHLHNMRSTDFTVWPGGDLGANVAVKPTWPIGEPLSGFEFPALEDDQAPFVLDDLQRPTLINIWASWCGPCAEEFPLLTQIALDPDRAYDVVFLDAYEGQGEALDFLSGQQPGIRAASDIWGKLADTVGAVGIPTSILLDEHHNVIAIQVGNYTSVQAALFERLARNPHIYSGTFDPAAWPAPAQFVEIQPFEDSTLIQFDESVEGTITNESVQQVYSLEGHAGDVISVRMDAKPTITYDPSLAAAQEWSAGRTLEPYVVLLAPDGQYLSASLDFLYEPYAQIRNLTLPENGTYSIVATRYMGADGFSSGEYTLTVTK